MSRLINWIKLHKNPVRYWREKGAIIGEYCEINAGASLGTEPYLITIGNHVRINDGVHLITHDGGVWVLREFNNEMVDIDLFRKIKIGNNVHIGTNAIIMPGVQIGNNCIIGCGAVVTKNVSDNNIVAGVPARIIESLDEFIVKHRNDFEHTKNMIDNQKKEYLIKKYKNKND